MNADPPVLSVVIAVYNEEESLRELYARLTETLERMGEPFEVIAVDDGSRDGTLDILRELHGSDRRWRVARLSRNFGQSAAIYAGFSLSRGDYVFMIDADLQVYPEDLPLLLDKLREGYDLVSGWRVDRHDNAFRKIMSRLLNRYTEGVTGFQLHDHGCSLKGFRRHLVEHMSAFSHRCRYLPVDAAMLGGKFTEVQVRHSERKHGRSKYNLLKLVRTAFDMITTVTTMPLQVVSLLGMICAASGALLGIWSFGALITRGSLPTLETLLAASFLLSGVQLLCAGLMCEYLGRIYIESQRKPLFIIQEELD